MGTQAGRFISQYVYFLDKISEIIYNIAMTTDNAAQIDENDPNITLIDDKDKNGQVVEAKKNSLIPTGGDGLSKYIAQVNQFPILTKEEEYDYAIRLKENGDKEAAQILVQSHLRLVVKMAVDYRGYGLSLTDLISEGNVGLVKAVKKFDPEQGFRFSTYAMWWVKANMQEYILKSWSLVKIGTTKAQKKLFFNLKKIKRKLGVYDDEKTLSQDNVAIISSTLNVDEKEVRDMDSRMIGADMSLNNKVGEDGDDEVVDFMASDDLSQEDVAINRQEKNKKEEILKKAFEVLNERERDILIKRQMSEISSTLDDLSKDYNISRERIRQIEMAAIEKIKKEVLRLQFA